MKEITYPTLFGESSATFSDCGLYRYRLVRPVGYGNPRNPINFLMLNPSTADEIDNDPTVARCVRRARTYGFGRLIVTNIFAYRATDPKAMMAAADPIGADNDAAILAAAEESGMVVCAWGFHGGFRGRAGQVYDLLRAKVYLKLFAIDLTAEGEPVHPLYQPYEKHPQPWKRL